MHGPLYPGSDWEPPYVLPSRFETSVQKYREDVIPPPLALQKILMGSHFRGNNLVATPESTFKISLYHSLFRIDSFHVILF